MPLTTITAELTFKVPDIDGIDQVSTYTEHLMQELYQLLHIDHVTLTEIIPPDERTRTTRGPAVGGQGGEEDELSAWRCHSCSGSGDPSPSAA